jgi:hypothetical protein
MIFLKKLKNKYIWKRIFVERLTEPLHLNLVSLFIFLFGSFRSKVAFDLIIRNQHAYCLLKAADLAKVKGVMRLAVIEFGVAAGTGLMNLAKIASRVTSVTDVEFEIYGFDTGKGMPPPVDYRDHPELYQEGDFVMNRDALEKILPPNVKLVIGEVSETLPPFLESLQAPLGFVSMDLDYYSSTKSVLDCFAQAGPEKFLPCMPVYFDDLQDDAHNSFCGELLAIGEFNQNNPLRKIERPRFLRLRRLFKNARWVEHIFTLHVLDHPVRQMLTSDRKKIHLENPYL